MKKTTKIIHDTVLTILFFFIVVVSILYTTEKYSSFDDYVRYYANISTKPVFVDEQISFYAFAVTSQPLDMSFYNALICDFGNGDEVVDTRYFGVNSFIFDQDIPSDLRIENLNNLVFYGKLVVIELRQYAEANLYKTWSLRDVRPHSDSVCIDEARVSFKTPIFGIPKVLGVTSNTFKYKVAE